MAPLQACPLNRIAILIYNPESTHFGLSIDVWVMGVSKKFKIKKSRIFCNPCSQRLPDLPPMTGAQRSLLMRFLLKAYQNCVEFYVRSTTSTATSLWSTTMMALPSPRISRQEHRPHEIKAQIRTPHTLHDMLVTRSVVWNVSVAQQSTFKTRRRSDQEDSILGPRQAFKRI